MPWCPKCKSEYREGILQCADCKTALVDRLPEDMVCIVKLPEEEALDLLAYYEYLGVDYSILEFEEASGQYRVLVPLSREADIQEPTRQYFAAQQRKASGDAAAAAPAADGTPYRRKRELLEETKSSAVSFLAVGGIGTAAVILILAGVLPFPFAPASKALILGVMSLLFLLFIGIGIRSFQRIGSLRREAEDEASAIRELTDWFLSSHTRESIDAACEPEGAEELDYYRRTDYMKQCIRTAHPVSEELLETVCDALYTRIYG